MDSLVHHHQGKLWNSPSFAHADTILLFTACLIKLCLVDHNNRMVRAPQAQRPIHGPSIRTSKHMGLQQQHRFEDTCCAFVDVTKVALQKYFLLFSLFVTPAATGCGSKYVDRLRVILFGGGYFVISMFGIGFNYELKQTMVAN